MKRWQGHESELAAALATEFTVFQNAARAEDFETAMVWAGEAVDLITAVEEAARIVTLPSVDATGARVAYGDPR